MTPVRVKMARLGLTLSFLKRQQWTAPLPLLTHSSLAEIKLL